MTSTQIPCYVINLERNFERLMQISNSLNKLNISFVRINAVDGSKITPQDFKQLTLNAKKIWGYELGYGEVGCFLSHRTCLELVTKGTSSYALIVEDDVKISPKLTQLLADTSWINPYTDIIKLDTLHTSCRISKQKMLIAPNVYVAKLLSSHAGAAGYIVSKKAAQKLLHQMQSVNMPIDELFFNHKVGLLNKLNVLQSVPALIMQQDFVSNLEHERHQIKTTKTEPCNLSTKIKKELLRPIKQISLLCSGKNKWWIKKQVIEFAY